jgi:hypothetical protein
MHVLRDYSQVWWHSQHLGVEVGGAMGGQPGLHGKDKQTKHTYTKTTTTRKTDFERKKEIIDVNPEVD